MIYTIELEKKGLMFTEVSTISSYNSQYRHQMNGEIGEHEAISKFSHSSLVSFLSFPHIHSPHPQEGERTVRSPQMSSSTDFLFLSTHKCSWPIPSVRLRAPRNRNKVGLGFSSFSCLWKN